MPNEIRKHLDSLTVGPPVSDQLARLRADRDAMREALEHVPCKCRVLTQYKCPQCGGEIHRVRRPEWMNEDQWDAVKAGDWYCPACKDSDTRTGYKYWRDSELPAAKLETCARCAALSTPPAEEQQSEQAIREDQRRRDAGPLFAGKPCPMCPVEIRNLAATVHNLAWRLLDYHGGCTSKIIDKFHRMKEAVAACHLPDDAPTELKRLLSAASFASTAEAIEELFRYGNALKEASDAVQALTDAHFADRKHWDAREVER